MENKRIVEGYWDCPQCKTKGNKGRFRYCQACGRPRGKVKFYLKETDTYVADLNSISKEPDWYCSYCNSLNSANKEFCESCGASQEESDKNYFQLLEEEKRDLEASKASRNYNTEEQKESKSENVATQMEPVTETSSITKSNWFQKLASEKIIKSGAAILSVLLTLFLISVIFVPKVTELNIVGKSWERVLEVEEYKTVREDDWEVPNGGRISYTRSEIHHYNSVFSHYKTVTEQKSERYVSGYTTVVKGHRDLGNGYFEEITSQEPIYDTRYWTEERQEPVYISVPVFQTKYYYDIERWVHKNNEITSGTTDEPYWASPELNPEKERTGSRKESYTIFSENKKGKSQSYKLSQDQWSKMDVGNKIKVKVSAGMILEVLSIN